MGPLRGDKWSPPSQARRSWRCSPQEHPQNERSDETAWTHPSTMRQTLLESRWPTTLWPERRDTAPADRTRSVNRYRE
jgi:hypothetical protein